MVTPYTLRRATAGDAEALARGAVEGVSGYGDFAPGLSGPGYEHELADARALLGDPGYHAFVAGAGGEVAGQAAVLAADATGRPAGDPTLGHLHNLFVAEVALGHRACDDTATCGGGRCPRARVCGPAAVRG